MTRGGRGTIALLGAVAIGLCASCECGSQRNVAPSLTQAAAPERPGDVPGPVVPPGDAAALAPVAPPPSAPVAAREPRVVASSVGGRDATRAAGSVVGAFIFDTLVDIAGAGPATATEQGVVMVNRDNQLLLAPLDRTPRASARPRETPLRSLPASAGPFRLARGPAVRGGVAYWVSRGRLLRRALVPAGPGSDPDVLREDARAGTRVAIPMGAAKDLGALPQLAAYVARAPAPQAPLAAKLWIEGQAEPLTLTDDVSSAHSVALLGTSRGLAAIFLDARTGMSSLHFRWITVSKTNQVSVGEDRIVWVGGPSRSSTEFLVQSVDTDSAFGLMMLERDITHFGLVTLRVPLSESAQPLEPDWLLYENGIEPAPVAGVELCGRRVVALARPSSVAPKAPQELVLLELERLDAPAIVLARAPSFFDISLCALGSGALLTYVADQRTWGRSLRCTPG